MGLRETGLAVALALAASATGAAQQPTATVNGDNITLRGCVTKAGNQVPRPSMLVWSRGEILLNSVAATGPSAPNPVGTSGLAGRVFYYLNDEEDLAKHIGQEIEIKGDLEDFEEGKVEVDRKGEYTEIELDLGGKEEKLRVPNAWLADEGGSDKEQKIKIVGRRVDVNNVRIIGACSK
jgi:hypothetical protein